MYPGLAVGTTTAKHVADDTALTKTADSRHLVSRFLPFLATSFFCCQLLYCTLTRLILQCQCQNPICEYNKLVISIEPLV